MGKAIIYHIFRLILSTVKHGSSSRGTVSDLKCPGNALRRIWAICCCISNERCNKERISPSKPGPPGEILEGKNPVTSNFKFVAKKVYILTWIWFFNIAFRAEPSKWHGPIRERWHSSWCQRVSKLALQSSMVLIINSCSGWSLWRWTTSPIEQLTGTWSICLRNMERWEIHIDWSPKVLSCFPDWRHLHTEGQVQQRKQRIRICEVSGEKGRGGCDGLSGRKEIRREGDSNPNGKICPTGAITEEEQIQV